MPKSDERREYEQEYRVRKREERRLYNLDYRKKNPDFAKESAKRYRARHPEQDRATRRACFLKKRYGMTVAEYDALLVAQKSVCAICKEPERRTYRGQTKRLAVDHRHADGKRRALLCSDCNALVGYSRERVDVLSAAIEYLRVHA